MAITNITEALDALKTLAEGLPAAVTVDDTLSVEGAAADAKAVGDNFNSVAEAIQYVGNNYVTNSAFIPMAETAMAHVNSRSNPHEVTAAQVTTDSGKTVEEALAALGEGGGGGGMSYEYGTEDLQAGTSQLETGKLYFVYE